MRNQPKEIYLCTGIEGSDKGVDFKKCAFVTWSSDRIHESDLAYIAKNRVKRVLVDRLNKYKSQLAELQLPKLDKTTPMSLDAIHERTLLIQELRYLIEKLDV